MLITYNGRFSYKVYFFFLLVICYCFQSYDGYDKFLDKNIFSDAEKINNLIYYLFTAIFDLNFYIFSFILYLLTHLSFFIILVDLICFFSIK